MATNRRISEFPEIAGTTIDEPDLLTLVHVFEVDPTLRNKRITFSGFKDYLNQYYVPKTGGIFDGNAVISGVLTVSGATNVTTITGSDTATFSGLVVQNSASITGTLSGTTVTGGTGNFTSVSATTATVTSGVFASGTAAAPSVSVGTTDNGLYSPGTDEVALATNGTGRLFISDDGKVGIGVSDPSSYNINADDLVIADPNGFNSGISINIKDNIGSSNIWFGDSDAEARGQIIYGHAFTDSLSFWVGGNQNLTLYESGGLAHIGGGSTISPAVSFNGSAPSDSFVIDSTGKLGVGTSSPEAALTVNGNSTVSSQSFVAAKIGTTGASNVLIGTFVPNTPFIASEGANPLAFMIDGVASLFIDSSRRVLVGTSSQSGGSLLQVNDDRIRIASSKTPASASDTGTAGEICWDASYIYVCTATDTWKRAALSTW